MTGGSSEPPPIEPGASSERTLGPLTMTDIVRYQGASGDLNPLHHDPEFARAGGFPGVISVGMLHAGILAAHAAAWLGPAAIRRVRLRFREQIWPGDVLTYRARVTEVREQDGHQQVDVDLACTRRDVPVVTGTATFVRDGSAS